jgi:hypothetical protein
LSDRSGNYAGIDIGHALEIVRADRALDPPRFDDKVYRLHLDVMTTLAQMLKRECRWPLRGVPRQREAILTRNKFGAAQLRA